MFFFLPKSFFTLLLNYFNCHITAQNHSWFFYWATVARMWLFPGTLLYVTCLPCKTCKNQKFCTHCPKQLMNMYVHIGSRNSMFLSEYPLRDFCTLRMHNTIEAVSLWENRLMTCQKADVNWKKCIQVLFFTMHMGCVC